MGSLGPKKLGECVGSKEVPSPTKRASRTTGEPVKTRSNSYHPPSIRFPFAFQPPSSSLFPLDLALYSPRFFFVPSCFSLTLHTRLKKIPKTLRLQLPFSLATYFFSLASTHHGREASVYVSSQATPRRAD